MAQVVCSLCSCRLDWDAVDPDALMCEACGHSLDDDHAASATVSSPAALDEQKPALPIFVGRKVI